MDNLTAESDLAATYSIAYTRSVDGRRHEDERNLPGVQILADALETLAQPRHAGLIR